MDPGLNPAMDSERIQTSASKFILYIPTPCL